MSKYFEKENVLFKEEWSVRLKTNEPDADFVPDGLLYRGPATSDGKYWRRNIGNESRQWDTASKRLLILTKDLNDEDAWDIREEMGRLNFTGGQIRTCRSFFYSNLTLWSYALINASDGNEIADYEMTPSWDELREFYETAPIARVNCKKSLGKSSCPANLLNMHLHTYGDLLLRQIEMYDADIILCCGGNGLIKDFIAEKYLQDLEQISEEGWMYFSPLHNKLVVNSLHPSYKKSKEWSYQEMMKDMKRFLNKYPDFTKPHR